MKLGHMYEVRLIHILILDEVSFPGEACDLCLTIPGFGLYMAIDACSTDLILHCLPTCSFGRTGEVKVASPPALRVISGTAHWAIA